MALTTKASGTWSPTAPVTSTLHTNTDEGVYLFTMDLTDLDNGDEIELYVETQPLISGSSSKVYHQPYINAQGEVIVTSIPVLSMFNYAVTAKWNAGTASDSFPWSVVTLQDAGLTTEGSGISTPTVGADTTLHTETDARAMIFTIDTGNMIGGDELEVTVLQRVLTGGSDVVMFRRRYVYGQHLPIKQSIPITSMFQTVFRINQKTGTSRSFPWSVVSIATD